MPVCRNRTKKENLINFRKTEYYIIVLRRQDNDSFLILNILKLSFLHNENISGCVVLIFLSMNICMMPLVKATQLID